MKPEVIIGMAFKHARGYLKMSGVRTTAGPLIPVHYQHADFSALANYNLVLTVIAVRFLVAIVSHNRAEALVSVADTNLRLFLSEVSRYRRSSLFQLSCK